MRRPLVPAIFLAMVVTMFAAAAQAAPCGFFSPNPDDDAGPAVRFYANLTPDEESAETESPGRGRVEFSLDRKSLRLSWKLTYEKLSSPPVSIGLHGPQTPGSEANRLYDLAQKQIGNGVEGSIVLKDADVTYMVHDRYYVNIMTRSFPSGEIRGPVKKVPPAC
jgi:hypothetical protein